MNLVQHFSNKLYPTVLPAILPIDLQRLPAVLPISWTQRISSISVFQLIWCAILTVIIVLAILLYLKCFNTMSCNLKSIKPEIDVEDDVTSMGPSSESVANEEIPMRPLAVAQPTGTYTLSPI
jgi:hypothetical protein